MVCTLWNTTRRASVAAQEGAKSIHGGEVVAREANFVRRDHVAQAVVDERADARCGAQPRAHVKEHALPAAEPDGRGRAFERDAR